MVENAQPKPEEVVAALLENSLLVPQSSEDFLKARQQGPAWLRNAYRHTFRNDICRELAVLFLPESEVQRSRVGGSPILAETARERVIGQLIQAAPMPQDHEGLLAEALRLSDIHMLQKPNFLIMEEEIDKMEALKTKLSTAPDEELAQRIQEERRRVAADALKPVRRAFRF